jgi:hypothetical protein
VVLTCGSRLQCHWYIDPANRAKRSHNFNQTENRSDSILISK